MSHVQSRTSTKINRFSLKCPIYLPWWSVNKGGGTTESNHGDWLTLLFFLLVLFDQWPQKFSTFANVDIAWVNNRPPLDEPPCGYNFEKCRDTNYRYRDSQIAAGVLGGILLIAVIVMFFVYRKWKVEQEIAGLVWKVDPKDLSNHYFLGGFIDKSASKVINLNPICRSISSLLGPTGLVLSS